MSPTTTTIDLARVAETIREQMHSAAAKVQENSDGSWTVTGGHPNAIRIALDNDFPTQFVAITDGAEPDPSGRRTVWIGIIELTIDLHDGCAAALDRLEVKARLRVKDCV